jgi:hypothetical protein
MILDLMVYFIAFLILDIEIALLWAIVISFNSISISFNICVNYLVLFMVLNLVFVLDLVYFFF